MTPTQTPHYETPTFSPSSAFAWTLRGGEVARLAADRRQTEPTTEPPAVVVSPPRCYEAPTFSPSSAFAWTLRAGEVARFERQQQPRLLDRGQLDVLNAC